ncbi:MAG: TetR family transcriptional regulator [Myxococcota bacterium]
MSQPARRGPRAERTRETILREAEALFAERGFAGARLEDVAGAVGMRRASLLYHFRDKHELYDAVLAALLQALHARVAAALRAGGGLAARVERAVSAWVDFVGERPALARIILREAAGATAERPPAILRHAAPFHALGREVVDATGDDPLTRSAPIDPVHFASAIAGATVFFIAVMPVLAPRSGIDPLAPEQLAAHRNEVLRIARRLLGTSLRAKPHNTRP